MCWLDWFMNDFNSIKYVDIMMLVTSKFKLNLRLECVKSHKKRAKVGYLKC